MFDNHVHSYFSTDSNMKHEEACERAIEIGLSGIAFTDHMDLQYFYENEFVFDVEEYFAVMNPLADRYSARLKILKGIEIGIQPHTIEEANNIIVNNDFDYVIGSVHVIDGLDPFHGDYYKINSKREAYESYLQLLLFMIKNYEHFDMLGHIEYITRYASYDDRNLRYSDYSDLIDEIFKELIYKGKGFEINTASFRERPGLGTTELDRDLLRRYRELGGELVCLASDAHSADTIGYKFDYYKEVLLQEGFKYLVHFEKRKPIFQDL